MSKAVEDFIKKSINSTEETLRLCELINEGVITSQEIFNCLK